MPSKLDGFDEQLIPHLLTYANTNQQAEMAKLLATRNTWWRYLLLSLEKGTLQRESLNAINEAWWQSLPKDELGNRLRELRPTNTAEVGELNRRVILRIQEVASLSADLTRGGKSLRIAVRSAIKWQVKARSWDLS